MAWQPRAVERGAARVTQGTHAVKIFVCIKRVPNVSEAAVKLTAGGSGIDIGGLPMDINDADSCAVEQAILLKEASGGTVHSVTIGPKEDDVMIRMALAKGCDSSIRIEYPELDAKTHPLTIARILAAAIKGQEFDLVLTGVMAADDGHTAVGVALAEELGVPHAAMVKKVDAGDGSLRVVRELEGGIGEVIDIKLPAVLTVQTGINKPRYAQIMGIRAAQKKPLEVRSLVDIGLEASQLQELDRLVKFEKFSYPEEASRAEFIEGDADAKAETLAQKIIRGGVL